MQPSTDNFAFLQTYQQLQYGVMYDEMIHLDFAMIGYSKTDTSTYWNVALTRKPLDRAQVDETEKAFASISRQPTFYYEDILKFQGFSELLRSMQYAKDYED